MPQHMDSSCALPVPLGRTVEGAAYVADLSVMPHLLIGGAPDSGARSFLGALLTTLLLRCRPTELGLLLADSTGRALRQFAGIPHLLTPVLTDPFHAAPALQWAVREMKERYRRLAAAGARNIRRYNETADLRASERLRPIVIVLTELADVMGYAKADAEACIFDLACMSRAAGIHLIVSTEDLSVAVLSGMVNVSLPARIAFNVARPCESRTMTFRDGAERLPPGDALFLPPSSMVPVRLHAPLVSDDEMARVTSYWRGLATLQKT